MSNLGHVKGLGATDYYVYVHCRLNSDAPFYIGKGRASRCISEHNRNKHWKRIVAKDGGFSTSFLAQGLDEELATLAEIEAIDVYRHRGTPLVNMTAGGDGVSGFMHSDESRQKMSIAHKGVKLSECHRRNAAAALIGHAVSKETRDKLSAANSGQVMTEEQRKKLSIAKTGSKLTEEHRRNISIAQRGKPAPGRSAAMLARWAAKRAADV